MCGAAVRQAVLMAGERPLNSARHLRPKSTWKPVRCVLLCSNENTWCYKNSRFLHQHLPSHAIPLTSSPLKCPHSLVVSIINTLSGEIWSKRCCPLSALTRQKEALNSMFVEMHYKRVTVFQSLLKCHCLMNIFINSVSCILLPPLRALITMLQQHWIPSLSWLLKIVRPVL